MCIRDRGKRLSGEPGNVVAVIGDGALTGGMAYEGLNNAGRFPGNMIVVLNDNTMSISENVGSIAGYLASIRTKPGYLRVKSRVERMLDRVPLVGAPVHRGISRAKSAVKHMLYKSTLCLLYTSGSAVSSAHCGAENFSLVKPKMWFRQPLSKRCMRNLRLHSRSW